MKFLITSFLLFSLSLQATVLRNGIDVSQNKIDLVWENIKELDDESFYILWRYARLHTQAISLPLDNKNQKQNEWLKVIVDKSLVHIFEQKRLIHNGVIDPETAAVICASYCGGLYPPQIKTQYWRKKHYPVASFIEKLPGYKRAVAFGIGSKFYSLLIIDALKKFSQKKAYD